LDLYEDLQNNNTVLNNKKRKN